MEDKKRYVKVRRVKEFTVDLLNEMLENMQKHGCKIHCIRPTGRETKNIRGDYESDYFIVYKE